MDWTHEDLAENVWQNLGEDADGDGRVLEYIFGEWVFDPGDDNGIDDDGNGYIDDFIGWDFLHNDNNPFDTNGHGTHVAGILGAKGDNGKGISGVTWDVQMIPIRIFGKYFNHGAPADSIISALNYAVGMGATISNNSWGGGGDSQAMEDAIRDAANAGHLFIAAAGNDGLDNDEYPFYPATYDSDNIISVAAINQNDQLASFSHYGDTTVHIAAPGVAIWSTVPADGYEYNLGTSMAAPHVSGAVALLWGLHHNRSYLEIKDAIISSAEGTAALQGKCVADGRLNLFNALDYFGPPPPTVSPCRLNDSLTLVALDNVTPGGISWWNFSQPMDTWEGVKLDENGCVNYLYIPFYFSSGVPVEITYLDNLETLFLNNNNLTTLPPEIGNITSLKILGLGQNDLATLPPEISNLTNLTELHLFENNFVTSPPEIGDLINLEILTLFRNGMTSLSPEIGNLINLSELTLVENDLTALPPEIGNLVNLKELNLRNNNLISLPPEIGGLVNLIGFDLYDNNLTTLPNEIGNLDSLIGLYLRDNELTMLPAGIGNLTNLIDLNLYDNNLATLPPEIGNLINLTSLTLNSNNLTTIPPEIAGLVNLSSLDLGRNDFTIFPPEVGNLINLSSLSFYDNSLTTISAEIGNLINLTSLSLPYNNLITLPTEIGNLTRLTNLSLYNNNFTTLPLEIGNLTSLENLNLYNNDLTALPVEIASLMNLIDLDIRNNSATGCFDENLISLCDRLTNSSDIDSGNNFDATWSEFCSSGAGACSFPTCRQTDSLALVALYNSTDGANWTTTWDLSQPMDTWHGVLALNGFGCVLSLNLVGNNLSGPLPPEIGNLINLIDLRLYDNNLTGNIPPEIGNLINLERVYLGDNSNLTGVIPPEIGNLTKLTFINFQKSGLTGNFPSTIENLVNLEEIWAHENQFSGDFPPEMWNLTKLEKIYLYDNLYTGSIPPEIGNLTALQELVIGLQPLTGTLPAELGDLENLSYLNLDGVQLSGCYHPNLANLCSQLNSFNHINVGGVGFADFCLNGMGACESVYPGDFNFDGTASEEDVLYWGLAYGNTGLPRQEASTDWVAQYTEDWTQSVEGVNSKHQDADGNGVVDDADLQVLDLNFGRMHTFNAPPVIASTIIYRLERNGTFSGNPAYDLYVEDGTGMPVDAHGVALTIDFGILPVLDIDMDISNSSLAPSDTLTIFNEPENRFHVALTRTDGSNQICDTPIASLIVIMEDIPSDTTEFEIRIENGNKIEADGTMEDIVGTSMFDTPPGDTPSQPGAFSATASALHAQCTTYGMAWVTASGGTGSYTYQWNTGETTETITDLTAGIYEVTVADSDGASEVIMITVEGQYLPIYDGNGNLIDCIDSNCPTLLTPGGLVPDGTYQADRTINSNGTLTGNTDYKAGETIILEKGFDSSAAQFDYLLLQPLFITDKF